MTSYTNNGNNNNGGKQTTSSSSAQPRPAATAGSTTGTRGSAAASPANVRVPTSPPPATCPVTRAMARNLSAGQAPFMRDVHRPSALFVPQATAASNKPVAVAAKLLPAMARPTYLAVASSPPPRSPTVSPAQSPPSRRSSIVPTLVQRYEQQGGVSTSSRTSAADNSPVVLVSHNLLAALNAAAGPPPIRSPRPQTSATSPATTRLPFHLASSHRRLPPQASRVPGTHSAINSRLGADRNQPTTNASAGPPQEDLSSDDELPPVTPVAIRRGRAEVDPTALTIDAVNELINRAVRNSSGDNKSVVNRRPYTQRIQNIPMPVGYHPPKFQQFNGDGHPKQHVAHFIETCNNAGTDDDLLVKQFGRSLKGNAFDCTRRTVTLVEIANLKQKKGEKVVIYINWWRNLSLNCKESSNLSLEAEIEMCSRGMHWELLRYISSRRPNDFQELATEAHNMEFLIEERGEEGSSSADPRKKGKTPAMTAPKEMKEKTKSSFATNAFEPIKVGSKFKATYLPRQLTGSTYNKLSLEERQAKTYPFADADVPIMLNQLLDNQLLRLPEIKRPDDQSKSKDPNFCKYHRLVGHSTEKCFVLKDRIMELAAQGRIEIEGAENTASSHAISFQAEPNRRIRPNKNRPHNNNRRPPAKVAPKPAPRELAAVDAEGWILVTRRKKPVRDLEPAPANARTEAKRSNKKAVKRQRKAHRTDVQGATKKKRRPVTLAEFFPKEFFAPPAMVATWSTTPLKPTTAKDKGKRPVVKCDDLETSLKQISSLNKIEDDLDLDIRSRQALIRILDRPEELKTELETLLMRKHDLPKVGLTPLYRKEEEDALSSPQLAKSDQTFAVSCPPCITFREEDAQLGTKNHNRPLFISGYIRDHKINRILVDCRSAVNILPIRTMKNIGLSAGDLSPRGPKNTQDDEPQAAHRRLGRRHSSSSHRLQNVLQPAPGSTVASFKRSRALHTSSMLQILENGEQKTVYADESPFTEVEASFADAKFYLTTRPTVKLSLSSKKAANAKSTPPQAASSKQPTRDETLKQPSQPTTTQVTSPKQPAHNSQSAHGHKPATVATTSNQRNMPILRYIPQSQRKKGEAPLVACNKIQPTPFLEKLPSTRSNEGFDPNAYRLMARAGGNLTKEEIHAKPPITLPVLTPEQEKLRDEGQRITQGRLGLGYEKQMPVKIYTSRAKPVKITKKVSADVHQVSVGKNLTEKKDAPKPVVVYTLRAAIARARAYDSVMVNHISFTNDDQEEEEFILKEALAEFEEGGQATVEELKKVNLGTTEDPQPTFLSASLTAEEEAEYMALLHEYRDIFAWNYIEMPGLDPRVAVHKLAVHPSVRPVKQSQRRFQPELVPKIEKEVDKLIAANFIKEVKYPSWIANIVTVKKRTGQIQVYVDFRDLNKACPKDDFPLPITELMVDTTTGHEALSFMDGSSGYSQIRMDPKDEELTAFRTHKGIFATKEPTIFSTSGQCSSDCDGKFLGFIVHRRGIEIDQSKIDSIQKMTEPRNVSKLKSFKGHLAYIQRFISNLAGRCQPFSRLLKKGTPFEWDDSCRNAFNNIKAYLTKPPVLVASTVDKPLQLYIAAQEKSVGALLAQCDENNKERSLYYLSRTLVGAELNYSPIEKTCLALIFAIQKLWHYLLAHSTNLISRADPLKYIMS
ncbi:hypothetical protein H6P81_006286 [Aristolochia fimbriata]|uniref:Reverse transcriptase/retrotransposon-derived protein RNase H-like domain-containing protein n=1 Tax=Aristolochia fimbriata TaxID=158543 RepID=A0AAV7EX15_ARIFI|nr:hypothetical protein H6P81_006286 [Aristolochia fimbriata]